MHAFYSRADEIALDADDDHDGDEAGALQDLSYNRRILEQTARRTAALRHSSRRHRRHCCFRFRRLRHFRIAPRPLNNLEHALLVLELMVRKQLSGLPVCWRRGVGIAQQRLRRMRIRWHQRGELPPRLDRRPSSRTSGVLIRAFQYRIDS